MRKVGTFLALFTATGLTCLLAQSTAGHIGRVPTAEELRRWESPILPDGTGLPNGRGNAADGEAIFVNKCAGCHGMHGEGRDPVGPQLVGGIGTLGTPHPVLTVGSYWPYTISVWDYIHRAMPYPNPGTLSVNDTYSVTAYILYLNHIIARDEVMNQQSLPKVQMPNRNGFVSDPRPDVHATAKRD
jgi:cytochrome c